MLDGITKDGLLDVYNKVPMGNCAELCAKEHNITREDQDNFAIESYKRAAAAWENGRFSDEVVPVEVPQRKGDPKIVEQDEEFKNVFLEKIPNLQSVFMKRYNFSPAVSNSRANFADQYTQTTAPDFGLGRVASADNWMG